MDLVELGARSMNLVDLEFLELGCLAGKIWSGAVFLDLELRGALPDTPLACRAYISNFTLDVENNLLFGNYQSALL
jgi:hypothetical protein